MFGIDPLTAGALLTLAAGSSDFCTPPKPTEINVIPASQEVKYDYSRSLSDLQGQEVDTINPYDFTGNSRTQGFMKGSIKMQPRVELDYKHYPRQNVVCIWYDKINIEFEIDPTIVIAKEVYKDRCMHKAVKTHELKHVTADRKIVNQYAKVMGQKVYDGLKQRGFKAGPVRPDDAQAIADRMQKTVFQIIEHEYKKMELDRVEAQQAIDSLEEYNDVGDLCPDFDKRLRKKKRR